MSSRALGLLHLAMHDAYFGMMGHTEASDPPTWLPDSRRPLPPVGVAADLANANAALTGAAVTMLDRLYGPTGPGISVLARETLARMRDTLIADYGHHIDMLDAAHQYGATVSTVIHDLLAVRSNEPGADAGRYEPRDGPRYFRAEPQLPVRIETIDPDDPAKGQRVTRPYHGPFYGTTVRSFAVTNDDGHKLAHYPKADYEDALIEVHAKGGAAGLASTTRSCDETVAALYWAYDGANLIGTPPRLYNQILRVVAWNMSAAVADEKKKTSEFVRLFALANVAMADAGKFSWKEKYRFELWRPLSGVREHDPSADPAGVGSEHVGPLADPFWLALGAPETNTDRQSFKPPFPAYPSGHATFGAACFQITRLYYDSLGRATVTSNGTDDIEFEFVSEEMDGVSRDLHQPYRPDVPITDQPGLIRTHVRRKFRSLWRAIYENAYSRVWLGVHWRFDAFDFRDIRTNADGDVDPDSIFYSNVWTAKRDPDVAEEDLPIGGVPLGLGIANDIFGNKMKMPPSLAQAPARALVQTKASNTGYLLSF